MWLTRRIRQCPRALARCPTAILSRKGNFSFHILFPHHMQPVATIPLKIGTRSTFKWDHHHTDQLLGWQGRGIVGNPLWTFATSPRRDEPSLSSPLLYRALDNGEWRVADPKCCKRSFHSTLWSSGTRGAIRYASLFVLLWRKRRNKGLAKLPRKDLSGIGSPSWISCVCQTVVKSSGTHEKDHYCISQPYNFCCSIHVRGPFSGTCRWCRLVLHFL